MTWGEMRIMIRELVGDPERTGGTANRYSAKQLADSINHAMKIYAKKTECTHTVASALVIGVGSVLDTSSLNVMEALGVVWNSTNLDKSFESFE